jgi:hypothetical protein
MYKGLQIKYPLFLLDFNEPLTFSTDLQKILKSIINILSVGAKLLHAGGRADGRTGT